MIFENKGKENTLETLHIALNAAKERGTTLVVASSAGRCAYHSCRARFERCGTRHQS